MHVDETRLDDNEHHARMHNALLVMGVAEKDMLTDSMSCMIRIERPASVRQLAVTSRVHAIHGQFGWWVGPGYGDGKEPDFTLTFEEALQQMAKQLLEKDHVS